MTIRSASVSASASGDRLGDDQSQPHNAPMAPTPRQLISGRQFKLSRALFDFIKALLTRQDSKSI
jgi:hypothetical protein